jgi:hypothetical protein
VNNVTRIPRVSVAVAFTVAAVVDVIQIPVVLAMFAGTISILGILADAPLATFDLVIDIVAACVLNSLLGFHWVLLPTFAIELVPGLDAAPAWTLCAVHVYHQRKAEGRIAAASPGKLR